MHLQQHPHKPWLKPHVQALLQPPLIELHQLQLLEPLRLHEPLPELASQQPLLLRLLKQPQQPLLKPLQQDNQHPPLLPVLQYPEQPEA